MKTVLLLDAGGPCSMAALKILKSTGSKVKTIACDMNINSAAQLFADKFMVVPPAVSDKFLPAIEKIIVESDVELILPTFHNGYEKLSRLKHPSFVTDFEKGIVCQDKLAFHELCELNNLPSPVTKLLNQLDNISSPKYIKPRYGVGSKDNYQVSTSAELRAVKTLVGSSQDYVVQDMLKGVQWTAEGIALDGKLISVTTYIVHEFKAGNSSIIEIKDNPKLVEFTHDFIDKIGLSFAFNLQVYIDEGVISIIEVNPRHGSGIEFLALAGCDVTSYWVTDDPSFLKPAETGIYVRYLDVGKIS